MPMSRTRIVPEVDFAKDGRQYGFLRLFHSVHASAYGFIPIPIVVRGIAFGIRLTCELVLARFGRRGFDFRYGNHRRLGWISLSPALKGWRIRAPVTPVCTTCTSCW